MNIVVKMSFSGKRFRQTMIDNDGRDKGRFISIEEHGMFDKNSIVQKTERSDDSWYIEFYSNYSRWSLP